jgi:hypothetical protein
VRGAEPASGGSTAHDPVWWEDLRGDAATADRRACTEACSVLEYPWSMRGLVPCLLVFVAACVTQEDPPYGAPGAIANQKFPGESTTSSGSTSSGGDGGSSGAPAGPFPAAYNETNPAPPDQATGPMHPTVANGVAITTTTACLSCHGAGQSGSQKKWAYAGWAASAPGATTGLDKGEVIVIDGAKVLGPVKTAPDGYFWIDGTAGTIGPNAKTAIRDKTGKTSAMTQALAGNGDCGNTTCHGGGAGSIDFRP